MTVAGDGTGVGWTEFILGLLGTGFGAKVLQWLAQRRVASQKASDRKHQDGVDYAALKMQDEADLRTWLLDQVKSQASAIDMLQQQLANVRMEHTDERAKRLQAESDLRDALHDVALLQVEAERLRAAQRPGS